ncbi:hypothetical protein SASPL_106379 [Salvia splendens]|uniref:ZCF37 n=1 Tax=Salvia splendens TaxID=180675 RepID=A0A8X8YQI8_SALSN|nr:uncharacterized protein LOC121769643 [Salvia splendens]KAG6434737.1 hypothetical protein SASPL_106379 [Salvia splendens]
MFICGSGSFSNQDDEPYLSPCSTPKRSRRSTSFCKLMSRDSASKNPYADRGLDKFYALLADLDDKKQKIYTQKGSEHISFVRFVYDNDSDSVKPIVIKVKDRSPLKSAKNFTDQRSFKSSNDASPPPPSPEPEAKIEKTMKKKRSLRCKGNLKLEDLKRPQLFFPVMVVLILVFLAIYGRSFAILCTSIVWYLAPTIAGGSSGAAVGGERKPKRKKEYVRKRSEKMAVVHSEEGPSSPKSVINGLQHDRKSSW